LDAFAFAFDRNTSFPEALREAVLDILELQFLVSFSISSCFSIEEVSSTDGVQGSPSKRLPKPVNGMIRAVLVAESS